MDEQPGMETAVDDAIEIEAVETASAEYLGRWHRLVSTTNWEKGRIIAAWRQALMEAGAPPSMYTDEAWSRRVGSVSPQHVGRLRRVHERFAEVRDQYAGLYWSHFQAALDWPDAEMWLEGAVQNGWSISQMRDQRGEAVGAPAELKPREEDILQAEFDEDAGDAHDSADLGLPDSISGSLGTVHETSDAASDASDPEFGSIRSAVAVDTDDAAADEPAVAPVRPFENLPPLPPDLNEAFELFKLAVLSHKVSGWQEVSRDTVLAAIEALKQLVLAPAG